MTQNKTIARTGSIVFALLILIGTAASAQSIPRSQLGSAFQIRYGTVETIEHIKVQSQAAQGAVTGGLIGGATSGHHHRGKHALGFR